MFTFLSVLFFLSAPVDYTSELEGDSDDDDDCDGRLCFPMLVIHASLEPAFTMRHSIHPSSFSGFCRSISNN